ncbi:MULTISPECIES: MFS transporter [unclassified Novosphingobium]|uniref:MFS transporter n=1 Tax=unclassified Novosphingobium TaxID=2644732 RepID=UPI0014420DE5|nr:MULTISPECIES: MFS transporter [unclassified Novosphingobium]MBB3358865.1 ACS family hexuronate transporter-like MFS transporter [Novosphingobium sp. BK256]MBB3375654.1 ACS family hexuronate transporter-like MFS transporter [Novosphingobium sp. BK280]MBB3379637.1 ACS family hexuronate transporter-like MFS transporter [Novosphingobium sp. BK258]MBB3421332.1 ACS family hexuronate transporter-like MFS transporter [Novosphingobium sp. BK267]MBB3449647.1 ACS family hexuronate transporter-like MFS
MAKGQLRWWMIGLVTLGTIMNYLARSTLSVAAPTLKDSFGMTTEQYSWVVLAFQASYTVMQTVAGTVLDVLGTRLGFFIFALGWALANMGHAFATGWPSLAVFRAALGATEAAAIPAGAKVVSEWFPAQKRPLATSCFQMGTSVGSMVAPALVAFCILWWGWQSAFLVTGALSLAWALLWWFTYRSPRPEERPLHDPGADVATEMVSSRFDILKSRSFWAIALPRFLAEPAWQTFNFFIPLYLVSVWKLDLKAIALWAWLPFLAADFGSLGAGILPGYLMRRGAGVVASRKVTMAVGALCMIGPACIGLAGSPGLAIALFCVGGFAHQMLNGALITLCADLFNSRTVGTVSGMAGSIAWIGGMLFTLAIGKSADVFGYNPLFVALSLMDMIGAALLWVLLSTKPTVSAA